MVCILKSDQVYSHLFGSDNLGNQLFCIEIDDLNVKNNIMKSAQKLVNITSINRIAHFSKLLIIRLPLIHFVSICIFKYKYYLLLGWFYLVLLHAKCRITY